MTFRLFIGSLDNKAEKDDEHKHRRFGIFKSVAELKRRCFFGRIQLSRIPRSPQFFLASLMGSHVIREFQTGASLQRLAKARARRPHTKKPRHEAIKSIDEATKPSSEKMQVVCANNSEAASAESHGDFLAKVEEVNENKQRKEEIVSTRPSRNLCFNRSYPICSMPMFLQGHDSFVVEKPKKKETLKLQPRPPKIHPNGSTLEPKKLLRHEAMQINALLDTLPHTDERKTYLEIDKKVFLLRYLCNRLKDKNTGMSSLRRARDKVALLFDAIATMLLESAMMRVLEVKKCKMLLCSLFESPEFSEISLAQSFNCIQLATILDRMGDYVHYLNMANSYIRRLKPRIMNISDEIHNTELKLDFDERMSCFNEQADYLLSIDLRAFQIENWHSDAGHRKLTFS